MKYKTICLALISLSANYGVNATLSQEINELQNQITALQQSLKQTDKQPQNTALGAKLVNTDQRLPLGSLPDTAIAFNLLQNRVDDYPDPLTLGGEFEGDAQYWDGDYTQASSAYQNGKGSGYYTSTVSLFTLAEPNDWTQVYLALEKDSNDNGAIDSAFVTFGNLQQSPYYLTVGNTYLPYGSFGGGGPYSNALTTNLFRVASTNQLILGWNANAINTNAGVYDSGYGSNSNGLLANVVYNQTVGKWNYTAGAGYISDIRGSNSGVGSEYAANGVAPTSDTPLTGSTGVYDLNASIGYAAWTFSGEYISTLENISVNQSNAEKMSAWMLGAAFDTSIFNHTTEYELSYSATDHMDSVPMSLNGYANPGLNTLNTGIKYRWIASLSVEIFNNIYLGPDLSYDKLYNGTHSITSTVDLTAYF